MTLRYGPFRFECEIIPREPRTHEYPGRPAEIVFERGWRIEGRRGPRSLTSRRLEKIVEGRSWRAVEQAAFDADRDATDYALDVAVDRMIDEAIGRRLGK